MIAQPEAMFTASQILLRSVIFKAVMVGLGFLFLSLPFARSFRIYRLPYGRDQLRRELVPALLVVLVDWALIVSFRTTLLHRMYPPSLFRAALTFAWMFVTFEVWFYLVHRLLHLRALYFLHAQHHIAHVTDPLTSLSFSIPERVFLIGGALGILGLGTFFLPLTLSGAVLYLLLNYALNVYGHSNTEWMPAWFVRSALGRVFFTTTFHAMHHARYEGHYGLFTVVLDRLLGTAFSDYEAVHALARNGSGLSRLGERVPKVAGKA